MKAGLLSSGHTWPRFRPGPQNTKLNQPIKCQPGALARRIKTYVECEETLETSRVQHILRLRMGELRLLDCIRFVVVGGLVALLSSEALGQPPQRFEVAVIRLSRSADLNGTSFELFEGGRIRITNEPVKLLIRAAFHLQNSEIAGGPVWLDSDRYDIEAKTGRPEKPNPEQLSPMIQNLLADRFSLKFHREKRELPVYALVAAKGGARLKANLDGGVGATKTSVGPGKSRLDGTAVSMELLAGYIGNRLGQIVVDKTGLSGGYDFTLEWAPNQAADSSAPSLVTALREQLGLRLESQKSPVEVLVIDALEKPSEN